MNPNQALWEKGDFTRIAESMRESGEALVMTLGITPGLDVLDLGCGDGTTALPAARLGANVLGVDIATNLVEQSGRCARGQPEPLDRPGPVALRQARAGEFPLFGQGLQSFLDRQPSASVPVRGAQLCNNFVAVRDQYGFAGPDQSDILREAGFELLHADGLHTAMVVTGGHKSQLPFTHRTLAEPYPLDPAFGDSSVTFSVTTPKEAFASVSSAKSC